jgi:hypothetical protein
MVTIIKFLTKAALAVVFIATTHVAVADEGKGPTMRPEIGKPLNAALEAIKAKKGKDALARVHEAESIGGKSPYESYMVDRVKGAAAMTAGEPALSAEAFEAALSSSAAPAAEKTVLMAAQADQYFRAKNYTKASEASARYLKEGGTDPGVRTLQIQALYLSGDLTKAGKELQAEVKAAEEAGKPPVEQLLQMLADISNRQKDSASFIGAMEKLVTYYPKKDYWLSLMYSLSTKPGLSTQLALDVFRLKMATGTLRTTEEYVEAAQLAIQAGFPAEAKKFIDAGYDAHLMGVGADADRHKRLRDTAAKGLAEDTKTLGQDDARQAAAATGDPLMNTGLNYVHRGQSDKGLPLMEQALKKGGFKRAEDAKLHLGVAQFMAGQKAKATETLRGVKGTDGTAEIARLWVLLARS